MPRCARSSPSARSLYKAYPKLGIASRAELTALV
jgi:hypothetical protein